MKLGAKNRTILRALEGRLHLLAWCGLLQLCRAYDPL